MRASIDAEEIGVKEGEPHDPGFDAVGKQVDEGGLGKSQNSPRKRTTPTQPALVLGRRWERKGIPSTGVGQERRPRQRCQMGYSCSCHASFRVVLSLASFAAAGAAAHRRRVIITAEVRHQMQVAPMTKGSRKVR